MGEGDFQAGAAITDLTPDRVLSNYNGSSLRLDADASPLRCQAVAFACGDVQGAIVSCDATFVDRMLLAYIRDAVNRRTGIPGEHVMVAATHSHAAPATCPSFLSGALPDPVYVDFFVEQTARAVARAWQKREAAVMVSGNCDTPGMEYNRRLVRPNGLVVMDGASNSDPSFPPAGPVDGAMPFLGFESVDGDPIALVVAYPCHNNAVGGVYSGDIGGRMTEAIQAKLGVEIPTPFLEAPCADVIWRKSGSNHARGDERAREIGDAIAEIIVPAFERGKRMAVHNVRMLSEVMEIPDRVWEGSTFCHDDSRGDTDAARLTQRRRYDPEEVAVKARGHTVCPVEVMGISFGDTAIVTNPAELFVKLGIEIRQRSPFGTTLVA
ncbi:MAG: hypothetical protein QGG64_23785, partial [Candidatus Latescibacteria bacterium]|nr:hypothetical protein [Candidatus Latescibacterota bacterium]